MKDEYETGDMETKNRRQEEAVGEVDLMNILHKSQMKEEHEQSELVAFKKKNPPPRPPPFKLPPPLAAAAAVCVKGDSKKTVISFASYISDQGMKASNSEISSAKEAVSKTTGEELETTNVDVDPRSTLNPTSNSKEIVTCRGEVAIEQSAEQILWSESDAAAVGICTSDNYLTIDSLSSLTPQYKQMNFETMAPDEFHDLKSEEDLKASVTLLPSGSSSALFPSGDHSSADTSLSWPSLAANPSSGPSVVPAFPPGPLLGGLQSNLSSVESVSSGASPHPASTPLPLLQDSFNVSLLGSAAAAGISLSGPASDASFHDPSSDALLQGPSSGASFHDHSSDAFLQGPSPGASLQGPSNGALLHGPSSGASLQGSSFGALLLGASPHPSSTPLLLVQGSSSVAVSPLGAFSANLPVSVGILGTSQANSSSCTVFTCHSSSPVSFISDTSFNSSGEQRKAIQAKPKVPPKPLRPKKNEEEETSEDVCGLKVPLNTHSLHQRVKEEMKIVTAARRLRLDEAEEVRIMEAELEERYRDSQMKKVQSGAILWLLPDKGTQQDLPKDDDTGRPQKFRATSSKNNEEEALSGREAMSQDVRRISSSTLSLQQRKQYRHHHVRHPSDVTSCKREASKPPSRRYSQTEDPFQPRLMWTGNSRMLMHDAGDPPPRPSPMMRHSYLSRSSNILDDCSYGSDQVVLPNSQSESALPLTYCGVDDRPFTDLQDRYLKEEKLLKLQMEIEKRRQHLFKLEQSQVVDWENTDENLYASNLPSRQHEASYGVIKPIDYQIDPEKYILRDKIENWTSQESAKSHQVFNPYLEPIYSSYEYLAHKTGQHKRYQDDSSKEFLLEEAFLNLPALSQFDIVDLVSYPDDRLVYNSAQFNDNVTAGVMSSISDLYPASSSCQPLSPFMPYEDIHLPLASSSHQDFTSQRDATPAMSLLDDVTSRTRNILRDIGSRPLSDDMEKYFQVDGKRYLLIEYTNNAHLYKC